jgi:Flp pilus assembly protein TadD
MTKPDCSRQVDFTANLQHLYNDVIASLQIRRTLKKGKSMRLASAFLIAALLVPSVGALHVVHAWTWDDDELASQDELDVQLAGYRKRVESGISLQERIVLLDRLIKLFQLRKRDAKDLENERAQVLSDENAIQTVSTLSRQKAQDDYQAANELIRNGKYKLAQEKLLDAERLNPTDKMIADLRQKIEAIVAITPQAPEEANVGDLVRRGLTQYLGNEPSKALNFLMYAQQKSPKDLTIPALVDLVKQAFPNESSEILDARLNLIDQKLQRALEKIYAGEYLVAAKECQEVLDLEPDNALALTRLGSVYYAMGQVKQARVYWKQALTLDAKNDVLKSFLSQTSSEADRAPAQALTYKIEKGDTLMTIAERVYNDKQAWRKLYDANRAYLKNPYQLTVGQVLVLPPGGPVRGTK